MWISPAFAQARSARVPLVVVIAIWRPRTFSGVNSRGEFPKLKSTPPLCAASMRNPPRSPAKRISEFCFRRDTASPISDTGMISSAPLKRAVSIVVVARRMSNTTQVVCKRSRTSRAAYSAGEKRTSICLSDIVAMVGISRGVSKSLRAHVMEKVLLGVASVWAEMRLHEQPPSSFERNPEPGKLFHHENLQVYRTGLSFMEWFTSQPQGKELSHKSDSAN